MRLSPNVVSFNSATSWKDIYGHVGGRKPFLKSDFYDADGQARSIVTSRDPVEHGAMRRLLSNAFSAKALEEQESIVHSYIDLLIKQIGKHATGKEEGEEMVKWYNWCTFDIIGDLAFGVPFGCLQAGIPHVWITTILNSVSLKIHYGLMIKYLGNSKLGSMLKNCLVPKSLYEQIKRHHAYSRDSVLKYSVSQNLSRVCGTCMY